MISGRTLDSVRIADAVSLAWAGRRSGATELLLDAVARLVSGEVEPAGVASALSGALGEQGAATISVESDGLRVGPSWLVTSAAAVLLARGIDRLTVHRAPGVEGCTALMRALAAAPNGPPSAIDANLWSSGFEVAGPLTAGGPELHPEELEARVLADWLYRASRGRVGSVAPLRRIVGDLLDAGVPDAGDTQDEPGAGVTPVARARRVCRLVLRVGSVLGLRRHDLEELGLAALSRDMGRLVSRGSEDERAAEGARATLRAGGFHEGRARRALAILEYRRDLESAPVPLTLFARVLRVADDFDALVYIGQRSPADALRALAAETGARYCPVVFQALVTTLGPTPPGTRVRLVDGRVAVVVSYPRSDSTLALPLVRVLTHRDGRPAEGDEVVDLAREGRVARVLS